MINITFRCEAAHKTKQERNHKEQELDREEKVCSTTSSRYFQRRSSRSLRRTNEEETGQGGTCGGTVRRPLT